MKWPHWLRHDWQPFVEQGWGFFRKQEGQDNDIYCRGAIERCRCGRMRIVPFDVDLMIVDVDSPRIIRHDS